MDQVLQQIGKAFGDVINNQYVQLAGQGIAIYFVVLWLAAAYWAFRDMQLRAENPLVPYLAASFVILDWSGWIGRCARGAERTSSAARLPPPG